MNAVVAGSPDHATCLDRKFAEVKRDRPTTSFFSYVDVVMKNFIGLSLASAILGVIMAQFSGKVFYNWLFDRQLKTEKETASNRAIADVRLSMTGLA